MDLYHKLRPTKFKDVFGQDSAIQVLTELLKGDKFPHAILLVGPSGCGKTSVARILKTKLGCNQLDPVNGRDFIEINAAESRGIDTIRDVEKHMRLHAISGKCRIWLFDECHKFSSDASSALLKILEDTPNHIYFILATTEPQKLLKTIITRCTEIKLGLLSDKDLESVIGHALEEEQKNITLNVLNRIIEASEGSARKSLVLLNQVIDLSEEKDQLEAIEKSDQKAKAIEICRALMNTKTQWKEMATILSNLEDEVENVRHAVLGYASAVLLKSGQARAFLIIDAFARPFYDSKKPGLVAACFEIICKKTN